MTEDEVIIVDDIPAEDYRAMVGESVRYALLSLPFTVNRMGIGRLQKRALNIAKGKISEKLFEYFCRKNEIPIETKSCETPFWTIDRRDFTLLDGEWDLKNNFYYSETEPIRSFNYTDFPALVPNRFAGDQWSKRSHKETGARFVGFLFTFLRMEIGKKGSSFFNLHLSEKQHQLITGLCKHYNGQPQHQAPFSESWFWNEMGRLGGQSFFKINFRPSLIITGVANRNYWHLFRNTGPGASQNHFLEHLTPQWYSRSARGVLNFMNGTIWTKITNATLPVGQLPSFLSLYPRLRENIYCAHIKKSSAASR